MINHKNELRIETFFSSKSDKMPPSSGALKAHQRLSSDFPFELHLRRGKAFPQFMFNIRSEDFLSAD